MSRGWVKIHREILLNPVVCKDTDYFAVWGYLLLEATHKKREIIFKGSKIQVDPGQLITGRKSISNHFGGNNKLSESKVQRILKMFESEQMIEQQTSNKNRLITIKNWAEYQIIEHQIEHQVNNNRTANEQLVNTNNNVKTLKNVEKEKNLSVLIEGEFNRPLTGNEIQIIMKWSEEDYSFEQIEEALLIAVKERKLNIKYIDGILLRKNGFKKITNDVPKNDILKNLHKIWEDD